MAYLSFTGAVASGQVARVPEALLARRRERKGQERSPVSLFLLSSSLQSGLWFCSRNFGSRPWSGSRKPGRSKSEAVPLGIPIPGKGPGPAQPQQGDFGPFTCLSVSLTLRDRNEHRH